MIGATTAITARGLGARLRECPAIVAARDVIRDVASEHGVTVATLTGHGQTKTLYAVRNELYWRLRTRCNLSFPIIGWLVNRHHSTVMHGWARHATRENTH